ncbi:Leucine-rich repeat-containing protein 74A [Taenia solium]|eukprot:TsM_000695600 transcript=TsM_000695600 gene=TsM_000695600
MSAANSKNENNSGGILDKKTETVVYREKDDVFNDQFTNPSFEIRRYSAGKRGDKTKADPTEVLKRNQKKNVPHRRMDEAELYQLDCTRQKRIPIEYYIKNIDKKSLMLCYSNIDPENFQPLSLSLGRNQAITILDLSHNWLGDEVLSENSNFTKLSLADNQITSKMAEQFFDVLSSMPNLVSLDLSENCLEDASATYIGDLLLDISVNDDFRILLDKSFKLLPSLRVIHGSRLTNNDLATYSLKMYAPAGAEPKKWLTAMRQLQNRTSRPILPYLIEADADKDMKLSRWETTKALEPLAIGLAPEELQALLKELDPQNENEVKISDFIENPYPKHGHHDQMGGEESGRQAPVERGDFEKTSGGA